MAKNKFEKQNLPWEARFFDPKRDLKDKKVIVLESWNIEFQSEMTYVWDIWTDSWAKNLASVIIYKWDHIEFTKVESFDWEENDEFIEIFIEPADKNRSKKSYYVSKETFSRMFEWIKISVVRPRKAPKVEEVEEDTKNQVEKLTRPSIEEYKEWSIYKVIKEGYLLPKRTKNNKYEKRSFLLEEGDILKINGVEDFFWRSIKSKNEKLFITVLRKWKKWKVEDFDITITSKDFINYTKWWLKPLKDTQKVQEKVTLLLDSSKIIPSVLLWAENS